MSVTAARLNRNSLIRLFSLDELNDLRAFYNLNNWPDDDIRMAIEQKRADRDHRESTNTTVVTHVVKIEPPNSSANLPAVNNLAGDHPTIIKVKIAAICVGVIVGIVILLILLVSCVACRNRRRRKPGTRSKWILNLKVRPQKYASWHKQEQKRQSQVSSSTATRSGSESENDMQATDSSADLCAICREAFEQSESVRGLPCHHVFHRNCFDQWYKEANGCPLCRKPAVPERKDIPRITITYPAEAYF